MDIKAVYLILLLGYALALPCNALVTAGMSCAIPRPSPEWNNYNITGCQPNVTATLELARELAYRFAPVLHFHPLEPYYLQDMDLWFSKTEYYLTDYQPPATSTYGFIMNENVTEIMLSPRTFVTLLNSTKLSKEEFDSLLAGAPFDEKNQSTAKVYFTVEDYNDALWSYNFNFFYSWNGCSNQAMVLNLEGNKTVTNYLFCPPGVHEADLERVSVMVCKSDQTIKKIAYSQHGWTEVRDCTVEGQCPFDPETGNPVSYAGLEGHGNYPESSPLMIYEYINFTIPETVQLDSLGGLYVSDRTLADPYKKWVPRPDNLIYLPHPDVILEQNMTELNFALFTGNWGAPLSYPAVELWCLSDDQTSKWICDSNEPAVQAVNQALKVVGLPFISQAVGVGELSGSGTGYNITSKTNGSVSYPDIAGPLTRGFNYFWDAVKVAPVLSLQNLTDLVCPGDFNSVTPLPPPLESNTGVDTVVAYLVGIAIGDILFSLVLILILALPMIMSKKTRVQQMVVKTAKKIKPSGAFIKKGGQAMLHGMKNPKGSKIAPTAAPLPDAVGDVEAPIESLSSSQTSLPAAMPMPGETPSFAGGSSVAHSEEAYKSEPSHDIVSIKPADLAVFGVSTVIWMVLVCGLYIAGVVLVCLGVYYMYTDSVITVAIDYLGMSDVARAMQILLIGGCVIFLVIDLIALFVLFFLRPKYIKIGKWNVRNFLGGSEVLMDKAFTLNVVVVGLMLLAINIGTLMFTLGVLLIMAQLATRIACNEVLNISASGFSVQNVCIGMSFLGEEPICGWQALQTCYEVTDLKLWIITLGSLFLLWSHLCLLILVVVSLTQQRSYEVVLEDDLKQEQEAVEVAPVEVEKETNNMMT